MFILYRIKARLGSRLESFSRAELGSARSSVFDNFYSSARLEARFDRAWLRSKLGFSRLVPALLLSLVR